LKNIIKNWIQKIKKLVKQKTMILAKDPFHPSLRTKHIKGENDLFELSVNIKIRIIWCYDAEKEILLLDIGYHDILEKY
jgi:mRNA-degrading endonuclease YafQ of YafQ-DinJ toxin-antitoxin module